VGGDPSGFLQTDVVDGDARSAAKPAGQAQPHGANLLRSRRFNILVGLRSHLSQNVPIIWTCVFLLVLRTAVRDSVIRNRP